jgi:hypothetical protein
LQVFGNFFQSILTIQIIFRRDVATFAHQGGLNEDVMKSRKILKHLLMLRLVDLGIILILILITDEILNFATSLTKIV